MNVLGHALNRISEGDRLARDFTLDSLRAALREVAVCFPVYRTYIDANGISEHDRQVVDLAIRRARLRNPATESSVFDFVRESLLPNRETCTADLYAARLAFTMKFQQYTGPLQAKGIEDTSFYRYNVLISLNEVGGDPQRFGGTITQFHMANQQRQERNPNCMLSTATHDTKRGEDARCRIHVLSEIPHTWNKRVRRWAAINEDCRTEVDGAPAPDRNDEYLFYQALLGCWPAGWEEPTVPPDLVKRLTDYMAKATKEAKIHTSWIAANPGYDQAVAHNVETALTGERSREFLTRFLAFQRRVAFGGMVNSLAQLTLKLTCPGVPDFFQGSELWELSLVDPDNRRPVDYAIRAKYLSEILPVLEGKSDKQEFVSQLLANWQDGKIKMYLTACGLRVRQRHQQVFQKGAYLPLVVEGELADHIVAYARTDGAQSVIVVVPRLTAPLTRFRGILPTGPAIWGETRLRLPQELSGSTWCNAYTDECPTTTKDGTDQVVAISDILATCPVAILTQRS